MTLISSIGGLGTAVLIVAFGRPFLAHWVGAAIAYDPWLFAGFALWWTMLATIAPCFTVQNGAGVVRPQLLGYGLYCAVSVVAKWFAVSRFGIAAIPYVGVLSYAVTVLPMALVGYRTALAIAPGPEQRSPDGIIGGSP
jgi:hypothetical protein